MEILVRPATEQDAEVLSKLATETFFDTYSWYNTPENMRDYTREHFSVPVTRNELISHTNWFFLAMQKNVAVGYVKLRVHETPEELRNKKPIEIERIYVRKELQGKKIGHLLLERSIEFSREKKFQVIWLGVWERNLSAIKFYEKEGFKKFGSHPFQLGSDIQTDLLLSLEF